MEALIHDLKSKLAIDLDESPATLRKMGSAAAVGGANYLVVGSSNARRLAAALNAKGVPAGSVICNGWRATKQSVINMAAHIRTELAASTYTAIIFQVLENNLYFACNEEGSLAPAQRDSDGCYHVEGDLVVADRADQYAVMKLCSPLWDTASGLHMVIVSPLPRYVK